MRSDNIFIFGSNSKGGAGSGCGCAQEPIYMPPITLPIGLWGGGCSSDNPCGTSSGGFQWGMGSYGCGCDDDCDDDDDDDDCGCDDDCDDDDDDDDDCGCDDDCDDDDDDECDDDCSCRRRGRRQQCHGNGPGVLEPPKNTMCSRTVCKDTVPNFSNCSIRTCQPPAGNRPYGCIQSIQPPPLKPRDPNRANPNYRDCRQPNPKKVGKCI